MMRETNTKELLSVYFDRQWRSILEGEAVNVYNCIILCNLQIDSHWLAIYILTPKLIKSTHIFDATCRESSKSRQLPAKLLTDTIDGPRPPCAFAGICWHIASYAKV